MKIVIYSGPGVGERSFSEASRSLAAALPGAILAPIGPNEVRTTRWHERATLFVMPGGRDLPYCEELNGAGTTSIRKFVENGGRYLGLCAGAYFASAQLQFEVGTPNEVTGTRELGFFPGTAIGSAMGIGTFSYQNEESAKAARVISLTGTTLPVYFDGGCYFDGEEDTCTVLGRYADLPQTPPAIILCEIGEGKALLSGVHPEFSSKGIAASRPDLAAELAPFEVTRQQFLAALLAAMDLTIDASEVTHA